MRPFASTKYLAGQNRFEYARQIAYSLSSTIGYSRPNRAAASATCEPSRAKENSGACTPITTRPLSLYLLFHDHGSVADEHELVRGQAHFGTDSRRRLRACRRGRGNRARLS